MKDSGAERAVPFNPTKIAQHILAVQGTAPIRGQVSL